MGSPKRRREDNIKTHIKGITCSSVDWIYLT